MTVDTLRLKNLFELIEWFCFSESGLMKVVSALKRFGTKKDVLIISAAKDIQSGENLVNLVEK